MLWWEATESSARVPVVSCPRCGKGCLPAKALRELERIRRHTGVSSGRIEWCWWPGSELSGILPIGLTPNSPMGRLGDAAQAHAVRLVVCFGVSPIGRSGITAGLSGPARRRPLSLTVRRRRRLRHSQLT